MWSVVVFTENGMETVAAVPNSWVVGGNCFWPPTGTLGLNKLIKENVKPDLKWPTFPSRTLHENIESYDSARSKCKLAEETSDLSSDAEKGRGKRKRKIINRICDEASSDSDPDNLPVLKKTSKPKDLNIPVIYKNTTKDSSQFVSNEEEIIDLDPSFQPSNSKSPPPPSQPTNTQHKHFLNLQCHSNSFSKQFKPITAIHCDPESIPLRTPPAKESISKTARVQMVILAHIDDIKADIKIIKNTLQTGSGACGIKFFNCAEDDTLKKPLSTVEEFEAFNKYISEDEEEYKKTVFRYYYLGGDKIESALFKMFRITMSNSLAENFSVCGKTKINFKDTRIAKAMKVALRNLFSKITISDEDIHRLMYKWLSQAKKRKGGSTAITNGSNNNLESQNTIENLDFSVA